MLTRMWLSASSHILLTGMETLGTMLGVRMLPPRLHSQVRIRYTGTTGKLKAAYPSRDSAEISQPS